MRQDFEIETNYDPPSESQHYARHDLRITALSADDFPASSCDLVIYDYDDTESEAELWALSTNSKCRRRGAATLVVAYAIATAKQARCHRVWLAATVEGRPLYEKFGFVPTGERYAGMPVMELPLNA